MIKRLIIAVMVLLIMPSEALALKAEASVSRTEISIHDEIVLRITVTGGAEKVDTSPIKDFNVIARGTSTRVNIINGKMTRETGYQYSLRPKKIGELVIPALTIFSDNEKAETREIKIKVHETQPGEDKSMDVFLEADIPRTDVYLGEQIIFTIKVFRAVEIYDPNIEKIDFSGFAAKQISEPKFHNIVINGRRFATTEINFLLNPLKEGPATIGPVILHCKVMKSNGRPGSSRDRFFMNDPFFSRGMLERRTFSSNPIELTVHTLPEFKGSGAFSGLIGDFEVSSSLKNESIVEGESTVLSIKIRGTGNIMDAPAPKPVVPDGFKVYEEEPEQNIEIGADGYTGQKTFRYALVAVKPGEYELLPVELNYFDVDSRSYKTGRTSPMKVTVARSKEKEKQVVTTPSESSQAPAPPKKKVKIKQKDILPLKENLEALENNSPLYPALFAVLWLLPAAGFLLVLVLVKVMGKEKDIAGIMAEKSMKELDRARKKASTEESLTYCSRALISAVCSAAGRKGEALTYEEAESILKEAGVDNADADKVKMLMEKIDSAKYGGVNMDGTCEEIISDTEKAVKKLCRK